MADQSLNCVQSVDRIYEEYYGFSILKPLDLWDKKKLLLHSKKHGGFKEAMNYTLVKLGFIPRYYSEGAIAFSGTACMIYVGNDYYAQTSNLGAFYKKYNDIEVWKCHN